MTGVDRRAKIVAVLRVASGNFLEMYDFMVFGYYAAAIGRTYFPGTSDFATIMKSLMVFGAGFLMRPLGGLILGAYIDRHGRRAGLLLTLGLMSLGTLALAVLPSYAAIGVTAPILILISRLLQGFSAGVELGGVSVYLSEIATPGNKGFYVSWQSGSQQVAVMFAALIGVILANVLSPDAMQSWGWRVPLLVGCAIIPFLFVMRAGLEETEAFASRKNHPTIGQVMHSVAANWLIVLLGTLMVTMTTVAFYLITAYTPTFGSSVLKLSSLDSLIVTFCVGLSNLIWLPISGSVSDRIGRPPILIVMTVLTIVTAYPAMLWLTGAPSFMRLLEVELWLSFIYGCYNGAMVAYLTEIMPEQVRTTGFSLAYSLATATFGGFTPAACQWLIHATGNNAMPGAWVSGAAVLGLVAVLIHRRQSAARDGTRTVAA